LVLARIIEPTRKLGSLRVIEEARGDPVRTRSGSANLVHYGV
jgi:hypothetical protein